MIFYWLFNSHHEILLTPPSTPWNDVANLALPFAQPFNPTICAAINLANGAKPIIAFWFESCF